METDHSLNDKPVVYVGPYDKARVVYIQLGHDRRTHLMPDIRSWCATLSFGRPGRPTSGRFRFRTVH